MKIRKALEPNYHLDWRTWARSNTFTYSIRSRSRALFRTLARARTGREDSAPRIAHTTRHRQSTYTRHGNTQRWTNNDESRSESGSVNSGNVAHADACGCACAHDPQHEPRVPRPTAAILCVPAHTLARERPRLDSRDAPIATDLLVTSCRDRPPCLQYVST